MSRGPWEELLLDVLEEVGATAEWDHLLHHVEDEFDAHLFEAEIREAIETLEAEKRITYSGVQGYEVIEGNEDEEQNEDKKDREDREDRREERARTDGGNRWVP